MANKIFGGKGSGHFSDGNANEHEQTTRSKRESDAEFLREIAEGLSDDLARELGADLYDPLTDPLEGLDLPETMLQPRPRQQSAQPKPEKKPASQKQLPQRKAPAQRQTRRPEGARGAQPQATERPIRQEKPVKGKKKTKKFKAKKPRLYGVAVALAIALFIESAYCLVIFTDWIKPLAALRSIYIDTAMTTMTHQWLATALIPGDVVQDVVRQAEAIKDAQVGVNSKWEGVDSKPSVSGSPSSGFSKDAAAQILGGIAQDVGFTNEDDKFFERFYELDEKSTRAYVEEHPEVIEKGWDKFWVHEAGLDDEGTDIYTTQGDQVLAIDAENGLMVVRVTGSTYQGVLVIGKDASRLKCAPSSRWGIEGEWIGDIAENNNGLVALTGSGFGDSANVAEGSDQAGSSMCSGEIYYDAYGGHYRGGKRIELHEDNRFYIVDSFEEYSDGCTDATEFTPALIIDGVNVAGEDYTYTAMNPRACIGQTKDESILMLGIEGRKVDSIGCNAVECAAILERYGAYQAMNLDGGTSAGVWYEGEYIMRCSNSNLIPEGRRLPNAWVYCADPVPNP